MGEILSQPLSLKDAIARSADIWDVWVNSWGTRIVPNPPTFLGPDSYPYLDQAGIPDSIAGIAIGPESDVDRVWITFNATKDLANVSRTMDLIREVSVNQPLLFTQAAKQVGSPLLWTDSPQQAQQSNQFYVFANVAREGQARVTSTELPVSYLKTDFTTADFNVAPPAINFRLYQPRLQLRFLLREGILPTAKRGPALYGALNGESTAITNVEATIVMLPIYGRKSIGIQMRNVLAGSANDDITFRVAVLRTLNYGTVVQEETVGLKTVTADGNGQASTSFSICNPNASYLILYATAADNGRITGWTVQAED